jgi:hypothetical protein
MMNIFTAWKVWRKVGPLLAVVKEARMSGKPFWKSRTIWINAITAAVELSGALTGLLPPGALQLVTNVLNIALRLITNQPVTVRTPSGDGD